MELTPSQRALLPSEQDVAFYREHGWWISPICLSDEALQSLQFGVERYYAGERDFPMLAALRTDWTEEKGNVLRQNDYVSLQMEEFRDFVHEPLLPAMAARLCGTSSIRLFHDQLVYKPAGAVPSTTVVGWHTDRAYWKTCTSRSMISAWVPLQDCTVEMGTMSVLDRSHLWEGAEELRTFHSNDMEAIEARLKARGERLEVVPFLLKKGQVSFHHCMTVHGSRPNHSDIPRIALAIHYQDASNHYCENRDANGRLIPHINDILCRRDAEGRPDYTDPAICPLLWEEQEPRSSP